MDTADTVSVVISALAFIVSVVTSYFTLFHKKISFLAKFIRWRPKDEGGGSHVCEISVSNTGNRELFLQKIGLSKFPDDSKRPEVAEAECDKVPLIIKPDKIELLSFGIENHLLQGLTQHNQMLAIEIEWYAADLNVRRASILLKTPFEPADPEAEFFDQTPSETQKMPQV